MPDDLFYAFGGFKFTEISEVDLVANIGLGKHWNVDDSIRIVTEVAAYQALDGGDSNTHMGFKLGFAVAFGGSTAPSTPKDSDNDGGLDDVDQCAGTPTSDKVDATGCSVFVEEEVSTNINVLFGNNSSIIGNANDVQFQEFADFMNRFPATDAVIERHASAPGNDDYNMMLSQKRAKAVRTILVDKYGIDGSRLTAQGLGETQLLDTSNTAEANKTNRRITAKVLASNRVKIER